MAQPYIGEIRMFAGNFAPAGWKFCDGQHLPVSNEDYQALFNLIGTTYGGNGSTDFAVPDLRGRLPLHQGNGFVMGETGGAEEITLTVPQIPAHSHPLLASAGPSMATQPQNSVPAAPRSLELYNPQPPNASLAAAAVASTGGSQPHTNFQPYLCVNFIICYLGGVFPSPT